MVKFNSCKKYNVKEKRESEEEESTTIKKKDIVSLYKIQKNTRIRFVQFIWKINYDKCNKYEE